MEENKPEGAPIWWDFEHIISSLDAREMIAQGKHPLSNALEMADQMESGDIFELITPFPPNPLIDKMVAKGMDSFTEQVNATTFKNYFYKS
ncbi:MAG: hypothetical protein WCO63_08230 [Bacteroidota bacterium]